MIQLQRIKTCVKATNYSIMLNTWHEWDLIIEHSVLVLLLDQHVVSKSQTQLFKEHKGEDGVGAQANKRCKKALQRKNYN